MKYTNQKIQTYKNTQIHTQKQKQTHQHQIINRNTLTYLYSNTDKETHNNTQNYSLTKEVYHIFSNSLINTQSLNIKLKKDPKIASIQKTSI